MQTCLFVMLLFRLKWGWEKRQTTSKIYMEMQRAKYSQGNPEVEQRQKIY